MESEILTIIADDESLARKKLRTMLRYETGVRILTECRNGPETVSALQIHTPDLLLLDVQMPGCDGFQVLSEISPDHTPAVIFTTAYDQYAVRAFEAHAFDYLLKPFDQGRLHNAIERVRAEFPSSRDPSLTDSIFDFLQKAKVESETGNGFVIKVRGRLVFLEWDEVDWIEAAANYVELNVGREIYALRKSIGQIVGKLDPRQFVRVHRSAIVNVRRIQELQAGAHGDFTVVLSTGKKLPSSRTYRANLRDLIDT